ncbi:hypothetical protein BCR34DRAFT_606953 [Clohesyomyces aquaticus]|uniref:Uncharacterized protein n=1 Tax=Clohesyomyces aquaticus TaxID=1231657 RepID=A0A1Y1YK57_9PLEO|nr:hypothetical protein BCR34DRAFT_606953 [Clohesyomyces aquaticus]
MNLFGKAQNSPTSTDITSRQGSAAEQDTLGSHFGASTDAIRDGISKATDKAQQLGYRAVNAQGDGSEQGRYEAHLSPDEHGGIKAERDQVVAAARLMMEKGKGSVGWGSGLGHDGQMMAVRMAGVRGVGGEQDRFGSHFAPGEDRVREAGREVRDSVKGAFARK